MSTNQPTRTIAIGDVHGCDTALAALLEFIAPSPADTLVFLGDLVDRGPNSKRVLDLVLEQMRRCRAVLILGNHEEMMLNALHGLDWRAWMAFGGREALASYGGVKDAVPQSHIDLMQSAAAYWETPSTIFVHANLKPGIPLAQQNGVDLRWTHLAGDEQPFEADRRVVCGHTPQKSGRPWVAPGWVCIDTDCQRGGWLTGLDVDRNWVWQANQQGETREFLLDRDD